MRDICYLLGIVERPGGDNDSERFVYFFAQGMTRDAESDAFAQAYNYLSQEAQATIYYYSKYERTIYRKLQAKHPQVCSAEDIERLFDPARSIELCGDVEIKATEWPIRSRSSPNTLVFSGGMFIRLARLPLKWFDRWCREATLDTIAQGIGVIVDCDLHLPVFAGRNDRGVRLAAIVSRI